jgi:PTS system mannose-specific IIA component
MIGTLILTHGGLARELLSAAQVIAGPLPAFEALALDWNERFEEARERVRGAIARLDQGQGVLILTDMFGSTPSNVATSFLDSGRVEVLTGVNLPMVMRLACLPQQGESLVELARWLQAKGRRSLCLASEVLPARRCENEPVLSETAKHD